MTEPVRGVSRDGGGLKVGSDAVTADCLRAECGVIVDASSFLRANHLLARVPNRLVHEIPTDNFASTNRRIPACGRSSSLCHYLHTSVAFPFANPAAAPPPPPPDHPLRQQTRLLHSCSVQFPENFVHISAKCPLISQKRFAAQLPPRIKPTKNNKCPPFLDYVICKVLRNWLRKQTCKRI